MRTSCSGQPLCQLVRGEAAFRTFSNDDSWPRNVGSPRVEQPLTRNEFNRRDLSTQNVMFKDELSSPMKRSPSMPSADQKHKFSRLLKPWPPFKSTWQKDASTHPFEPRGQFRKANTLTLESDASSNQLLPSLKLGENARCTVVQNSRESRRK